MQVGTDADWGKVGVGAYTSYAIKYGGSLWSRGWNRDGQLGLDSSDVRVWSPQTVDSDVAWVTVEAGPSYAMGIKADGTLWGWGSNGGGQLGLGDTGMTLFWEPTRLHNAEWTVERWRAISASEDFSHAIASDGTLWAWGDNGYSELGDGTGDRRTVPQQIGGADTWSVVTAGQYGGRALRYYGSMWAWGYDDGGARRFGDGSAAYTQYYAPKSIFGGVRAAGQQPVDVVAGSNHALMLKGDGTLWGWGGNQYGSWPWLL